MTTAPHPVGATTASQRSPEICLQGSSSMMFSTGCTAVLSMTGVLRLSALAGSSTAPSTNLSAISRFSLEAKAVGIATSTDFGLVAGIVGNASEGALRASRHPSTERPSSASPIAFLGTPLGVRLG